MKVDAYLKYVPEIERSIADLKPDAIVYGMGPTAWLLPWLNQKLLQGVRIWTCHDGCRIMPANDLVIMDPPVKTLHPDTTRYKHIVEARPQRIWCITSAWEVGSGNHRRGLWSDHLHPCVRDITKVMKFRVWNPSAHPKIIKPKLDSVDEKGEVTPDTIAVSPTGTTTLAWALGARRIGVIGVDMMPNHHHTFGRAGQVDAFFTRIADLAYAAGGEIRNLSPVTSLKRFKEWKPSVSGSAPTVGSETPVPNPSSNTASASTQSDPSKSTGCAVETQASK